MNGSTRLDTHSPGRRPRLTEREVRFLVVGALVAVSSLILRFGVLSPLKEIGLLRAERARLALEVRVAEKAADRLVELNARREALLAEAAGFRHAALPGMTGERAAMRFLARLDGLAESSGLVVVAKSARSLSQAGGWEGQGAEVVVTGRVSQVFAFLHAASVEFPALRLESLNLSQSQGGAGWEARVFLVLPRPVDLSEPSGVSTRLTSAARAPGAGPGSSQAPRLPNLLSGRVFGERPLTRSTTVSRPVSAVKPEPPPTLQSAFQLLGFSDDRQKPRALLMETATGRTVIAGVGDHVGDEQVLAISRRGVEVALPDDSRRLLPLP